MIGSAVLLAAVLHAASAASPPSSTFFSTAAEESFSTYQMNGDGDLWPSCWADDGHLYAANGDGNGFRHSGLRFDIAVSRISGMPPDMTGATLATNIGTNWSGPDYNRKPTGMLCAGHAIYLAFQNLNLRNFSDAPAASIARSADHGVTWSWDKTRPMFANHQFTTIFFLDYGRDAAHATDSYAYAYGLDHNWRAQTELFLARVPRTKVQDRSAWQFYSGAGPAWSADINAKVPVLRDGSLLYRHMLVKKGCPPNQPTIAQGGVVYDAPLRRYIFSSWSCATHRFYEAPEPWGPWRLFLSKDFGPFQSPLNRGMYGISIPSKFIHPDGRTLYVQSNICCSGNSYTFALRKLFLEPYTPSRPANTVSPDNHAVTWAGARAISKSTRHGSLCGIDCSDSLNGSNVNGSEDDYDGENKHTDWWGYTWPKAYRLNKLVYVAGTVTKEGGWFTNFQVQVRRRFQWINVSGLSVNPPYAFNDSLRSHSVFTIRFDPTWGDGVRIIGTPGGPHHFTSIAELGAYYDSGNLVSDGAFEFQLGPGLSGLWRGEGSAPKGVTRFEGRGHSGVNNAWIKSSPGNWNAVTQTVPVRPHTTYVAHAWIRSNLTGSFGRFGVRAPDGRATMSEATFAAASNYTRLTVRFNSAANSSIDIYIGIRAPSGRQVRAVQIDDVSISPQ